MVPSARRTLPTMVNALSYSLTELLLRRCLMRTPSWRSWTSLTTSPAKRLGMSPLSGIRRPRNRMTSVLPKVVIACWSSRGLEAAQLSSLAEDDIDGPFALVGRPVVGCRMGAEDLVMSRIQHLGNASQ